MKFFRHPLPVFFVFIVAMGLFLAPLSRLNAQTAEEIQKQEAKLQAEYDAIQKEIEGWQKVLDETRLKANTLQGDITGLTAKIKEAELKIKQKNIAIASLGKQILEKGAKIRELEGRINTGKESLAELLRKTNEIDSYSLIEIVFTNKNLSEFFEDLDSFASIKKAMKEHFTVVREAKANTEVERVQLDQKKNQETDAKYVVETQKKTIAQTEAEKKKLLSITKTEEKGYQMVLAERQQRAAQIRAALFKLRDTEGIPFAKALEFANYASSKTGVRASLILAILTQESDLGKNQGSCILSSLETGDGVGKNTGTPFQQVMKAPRDTVPFKEITGRLGRDWKITPVSCPPGTSYYVGRGFGGAMGPSQFIPSTWELFKNRIGAIVGVPGDGADPWNPKDAFVATSIYLSDLGAIAGSYTGEINAACRYYSGRSCDNQTPSNKFYGNQVMEKAEGIQANIDFLKDL